MDKPLKIIIVGHAGHGKSTVAKFLADRFNLSYAPTSELLIRYIPAILTYFRSRHGWTAEDIIRNKDRYREILAAMIQDYEVSDMYTTPKYVRCAELVLGSLKMDIYDGMRDGINQLPSTLEYLKIDLVIYVDASHRVDLEPSMTILQSQADYVFDNNGSLKDVRGRLHLLECFVESYIAYKTKLTENLGEYSSRFTRFY